MTDEERPPYLPEASPGLVWRKRRRKGEWVATWLARTDIIKRGYSPRHIELWSGAELTEAQALDICQRCQHQQFDMLMFGKDVPPPEPPLPDRLTGSLKSLIHCYRTDADSPYAKNRYHVRQNRDSMLRRIGAKYGDELLSDIKWRTLLGWHRDWSLNGKSSGLSFVAQLRALFSFGALLEDPDCERLCGVMHKMRFEGVQPRSKKVTAEYAEMIRAAAHQHFGWPSIALAQAIQFECTLRQKDVMGEVVPLSEPGVSAVIMGETKWLRGIVWSEVDENFILRHVTSKKLKMVTIDLKLAPMVMEELALMAGVTPADLTRDMLPASGPIVTNELTALPWKITEFRRKWRLVANHAGVPSDVWNMDSRSGAISEADLAGAPSDWVRQAAAHSSVDQTIDYTRNQEEATAKVMKLRMENRNRPKTDGH